MELSRIALHRFLLISGVFLGLGCAPEAAMSASAHAGDGQALAGHLPGHLPAPDSAPAAGTA